MFDTNLIVADSDGVWFFVFFLIFSYQTVLVAVLDVLRKPIADDGSGRSQSEVSSPEERRHGCYTQWARILRVSLTWNTSTYRRRPVYCRCLGYLGVFTQTETYTSMHKSAGFVRQVLWATNAG